MTTLLTRPPVSPSVEREREEPVPPPPVGGGRAGFRSRLPRVALRPADALLPVAMLLWLLGAVAVNPEAMNDYGLLPALPLVFYVGVALLVASIAVVLGEERLSPVRLALHLAALVIVLHGTAPLVFAVPNYPWLYKHIGVVSYINVHGGVDTAVDIYHNWPGFFALAAWLTTIGGDVNPVSYAGWAPVYFNLLSCLELAFVFRWLPMAQRSRWVALFLFVPANWVGQDYFAPQALAFVVSVAVFGMLLAWFQAGRPVAVVRRLRRLAGRFVRSPSAEPQGDDQAPSLRSPPRFVAIAVLFATFGVLVATHQLSPYVVILGAAVLSTAGLVRPRWVVMVLAAMAIGYLLLHFAYVQRTQDLFGSIGNPLRNLNSGNPSGSEPVFGRRLTALAGPGLIVGMWGLAALGTVRRLWAGRPVLVPVLLAACPALIAFGQNYGGEAVFRIYLFSLPWVAVLAAYSLEFRRHRWKHTVAIGLVLASAVGLFVSAFWGAEPLYRVRPGEVEASQFFYDNAEPGSVLTLAAPNFPTRLASNYDQFALAGANPPAFLETEKSLRHRAFGPDYLANVATFVANHAGTDRAKGYLALSQGQVVYSEIMGLLPRGSLAALQRALEQSPDWELYHRNEDAAIYRLAPERAREGPREDPGEQPGEQAGEPPGSAAEHLTGEAAGGGRDREGPRPAAEQFGDGGGPRQAPPLVEQPEEQTGEQQGKQAEKPGEGAEGGSAGQGAASAAVRPADQLVVTNGTSSAAAGEQPDDRGGERPAGSGREQARGGAWDWVALLMGTLGLGFIGFTLGKIRRSPPAEAPPRDVPVSGGTTSDARPAGTGGAPLKTSVEGFETNVDTAPEQVALLRQAVLTPDRREETAGTVAARDSGPHGLEEPVAAIEPASQAEAVRVLGEAWGPVPSSEVRPLLADRSDTVRAAAVALIDFSPEDVAVLHGLIREDLSPKVRAAAVFAMAQAPEADQLSALEIALGDPDPGVRAAAAASLPSSGPTPAVNLLLAASEDADENVRRAAQHRFATGPAWVLWLALEWCARRGTICTPLEEEVGQDALAALALERMYSPEVDSRVLAIEIAGRVGTSECLTQVTKALHDPQSVVRQAAAFQLKGRTEALPSLIVVLHNDPDPSVRLAAAAALDGMEHDEARMALIAAFGDPSIDVRDRAVESLLHGTSPGLARRLLDVLTPLNARWAGEALLRMGAVGEELLAEALTEGPPERAAVAAELIRRTNPSERFLADLHSLDPPTRLRAVNALGALGGSEVVDGLVAALEDAWPVVRARAAYQLGRIGDLRAYAPVRRAADSDQAPEVVQTAREAAVTLEQRLPFGRMSVAPTDRPA